MSKSIPFLLKICSVGFSIFLSTQSGAFSQTLGRGEEEEVVGLEHRLDEYGESADFERGELLAGYLLARYPQRATIHLSFATLLRNSGRTDEAVREFQKANALDPTLADPLIALAEIALENLEVEKAHKLALAALKLEPGSVAARTALVNALIQSDAFSDAEKELAPMLARSGRSPSALHLFAEVKAKKGDFLEARKYLEQAIAQSPGRSDWSLELAKLMENTGDGAAARVCLERVVKAKPISIEARLRLARNLEVYGHNYDEAINMYNSVLRFDSSNGQAIAGIDRCNSKKNNIALRLKLFLQSLGK